MSVSYTQPQEPAIAYSPASLDFTAIEGRSNPSSKTVNISNTGGGTLSWNVSADATWLTLGSTNGTDSGSVVLSVDITGLAVGTHNATITITDSGAANSPVSIPVSLMITEQQPNPTIDHNPANFSFTATVDGLNPASQDLNIANTGTGTLNWGVSDDATWLVLSSTNGTDSGAVTLSVDITGLSAGSYNASITITDLGAINSPVEIPVSLTITATQQPAKGKIAFSSSRDGNHEIYVMNADGTNQKRLTNNPAEDYAPSWSPDGSKIAFASNRDGDYEIYVMFTDGTNLIQLTDNVFADTTPFWSPDGTKIVYNTNRDGNEEIYRMQVDGTNPVNLTNNPAHDSEPHWSPDGSRIVFSSNRISANAEIWLMNSDGLNPQQLTHGAIWGDRSNPRWTPDGNKIAYTYYIDIYVMDADGANKVAVTAFSQPGNPPYYTGSYSPDGSQMVIHSNTGIYFDIYVMNADGSNPINLTNNNPSDDQRPHWTALDNILPVITSVTPANTATGVGVNTTIIATFSELMDAATINTTSFTVSDDVGGVAGAVSYDSGTRTASFTPAVDLADDTVYTATITTVVKDLSDNNMAADYTWYFTTDSVQDITQPTVISTNPDDNVFDVAVNTTISLVFSEAMDASSITTSSFTLNNGVTGTVSYDQGTKTATFMPSSNLANATSYTASITTQVKDLAANHMVSSYMWDFSTIAASLDADGDGVLDNEDDNPNNAMMASPASVTGTGKIVINTSANVGTYLTEVKSLSDSALTINQAHKPTNYRFNDGLVAFRINGVTPGGTVVISITYPTTIPAGAKYFKVDSRGFHAFTGALISGNTVTLTLTDGGNGDRDGMVNGVIDDPGGVGVPISAGGDNGGGSGSSSKGGGVFSPLLLLVLPLMLYFYRYYHKRMRHTKQESS